MEEKISRWITSMHLLHDNNSNWVIIMMHIKETVSATNHIKHGSFPCGIFNDF